MKPTLCLHCQASFDTFMTDQRYCLTCIHCEIWHHSCPRCGEKIATESACRKGQHIYGETKRRLYKDTDGELVEVQGKQVMLFGLNPDIGTKERLEVAVQTETVMAEALSRHLGRILGYFGPSKPRFSERDSPYKEF